MKSPKLEGRYLITGAAGFIGSHLTERLLKEGAEVIGVDNFITGRPRNVQPFLGNRKFEFLEHDIIRPFEVQGRLDGIFHLASPASPVDYAKYPIETLRVGSMGSDHVLKLAQKASCPILVASTSEIYGDPLQHPQKESYWGNVNSIGPRGCYDESKRYLEAVTMAYHRALGVSTRIIRIFNTYGPRMRTDDGRVVPNFFMQALAGQNLTVYGKGDQTRSFCFVDDLVEGMLRVFAQDSVEPFNLGNPNEMTILQFAEKIRKVCGAKVDIVFKPLPQDDPTKRQPDITRAREKLGWEPKVDLDRGLQHCFEYFKAQSPG
jgi:dTDP-glucose 4,6-dehydratase